jgi:CO dehydrogenase nickel-insertion accessory protein CooC1
VLQQSYEKRKKSHQAVAEITSVLQKAIAAMSSQEQPTSFYLNNSYRDIENWLLVSDKICEVLVSGKYHNG